MSLFNQYLNLIKTTLNGDKLIVLNRDSGGIPVPLQNDEPHEKLGQLFEVDPFGGVFIAGYEMRKKHFQIRASLINSIIDYSYKIKIDYFVDKAPK
jgi:hypothetical protein